MHFLRSWRPSWRRCLLHPWFPRLLRCLQKLRCGGSVVQRSCTRRVSSVHILARREQGLEGAHVINCSSLMQRRQAG